MELRSTEEQVQEMRGVYQSLCEVESRLPELASQDDDASSPSSQSHISDGAADVLTTLESLKKRLDDMKPKTERFRKRLDEKDPITGARRYGEKTASRVETLLATYDALVEAVGLAFGEEDTACDESNHVVSNLRQVVSQQEEAARQAALEEQEQQDKLEQEQREQEERQRQEQERLQEQARLAQAREQAELARRAREVRTAREQAQEEERMRRQESERADREWMDSIAKGPEGVREQLERLRESTSNAEQGNAHETAVTALHTLFSQIVAHPEEPNFRRVRRDHPKFHEDIGRHAGGREVLIAAGFRLGAIDDVPCFISTEPNIEKEMDAWSEWFDLLKATLEILEEEMIKS